MKEKKHLHLLAAIAVAAGFLVMAGTENAAFADQPYIAAYGIDGTTVYNAKNAFMRQYFLDEDGNHDIDQDLLSVLSLAGSTGGTSGLTGFSYQSVIRWDANGNIYSDDQVWGPNSAKTSYGPIDTLIEISLVPKSQLNYVTSFPWWSTDFTKVNFEHLIVKTDGTSFINNNQHTRKSWEPGKYFLYGKCSGSACFSGNPTSSTFGFFQFGIESETEASSFKVKQSSLRFNNAATGLNVSLVGKDAYLVYGDTGVLHLWWTDNTGAKRFAYIGGFSYDNIYPKAKLTDGSWSDGIVQWDDQSCGGKCLSLPRQLW